MSRSLWNGHTKYLQAQAKAFASGACPTTGPIAEFATRNYHKTPFLTVVGIIKKQISEYLSSIKI
jgi:hypothetical protein